MSFNQLQDTYRSIDSRANDAASILKNQYVAAVLQVIFIGYAAKFATQIPVRFHWIFTNPLFRVAILSLILWSSSKNAGYACVVMGAFIAFTYFFNKRYEGYTGFKTAIYPGCTNTTQADLLDSFGGNRDKLAEAMQDSLVPFNIIISDESAPLIATYLMNHGYKLKFPCAPPGSTP